MQLSYHSTQWNPIGFTLFSTMTLKIIKYDVNYLKMWYGRVYTVVGNYSWSL